MGVGILEHLDNVAVFGDIEPERLMLANINPKTGFATDYLNVFNEAVMLFGLLGDMPDMIEDLEQWEFLDYKEHFRRSNFQGKELAIAVYDLIPDDRRIPFEQAAHDLGDLIEAAIKDAREIIDSGVELGDFASETSFALQSVIIILDSMIHGKMHSTAQDDVDALFD